MSEHQCECGHKHEEEPKVFYHGLMRYASSRKFWLTSRSHDTEAASRAYADSLRTSDTIAILPLTYAEYAALTVQLESDFQ